MMNNTPTSQRRSPLEDPAWLGDLELTEAHCRRYLEELRWPESITCPRCASRSVGAIPVRKRHYCRHCRHQFSLTSGTVFHNSHLPIWKWFLAVQLLLESDGGIPANQLVNLLGGSYKTAWFVEHRIRAAFVQAGESRSDADAGACYHRPDRKYLRSYRAETSWRARCKDEPLAFERTVLALLAAEPVPYGELTGSSSRSGRRAVATA
jgi:transposase-like protein